MASFNNIIAKADELHEFENQIPEEYECVKLDEIIGKTFTVDIFTVYHDKEKDIDKVALAIVCDNKKYRIHTGAKRIVEIFQMVNEHNAENPDDPIDVKDGFHQIEAIPVNKGTMLVFH